MSDLIKIAVDAMGGDGSPKKIIEGIILNHSKNKNNFYKIFGDRNKIHPLINQKVSKEFFEIIHTDKKIEMETLKLNINKKQNIEVRIISSDMKPNARESQLKISFT